MASNTIVSPIVLIAAEAEEIREAVGRALRAYGVRQIDAAPRARAVETARRVVPDVVLVIADRQLREPAALVTELRADTTTRDTPILVRLGGASRATADALLVAGADTVLVESAESASLAAALFRLADVTPERRAVRELRRRLAPIEARTISQRTDEAARQLRISRVASALQQARTAMLAMDSTGRCVAANAAAAAATGFAPEEIVGRAVWSVILPAKGRDLHTSWSTFLIVGTFSGACTLRRKYGAPAPAQLYAATHVLPDVHIAAVQPAT